MERTGVDNLIAYWNTTLQGVRLRPSLFFEMTEDEVLSRQIPGIRTSRVFWRESGLFSARREYMRISRRELVFDVCGFPLGDSFTVSWWLGTSERNIRTLFFEIPILGSLLEARLSPVTYYEVDSETAYQRAIHDSILLVVDTLTEDNELPRLTGPEREPIMADFYE